jgi:hypothetical protein
MVLPAKCPGALSGYHQYRWFSVLSRKIFYQNHLTLLPVLDTMYLLTEIKEIQMKAKPETYIDANGVKVTVLPMAAPRAGEKTFRNNKYSVYNQGHQASALGARGFKSS